MSITEARGLVPRALRREYRRRFNRSTLTRACFRWTTEKVRCRASWRTRSHKYRGQITLWNDPADPADAYIYRYSIRRQRLDQRPTSRQPRRRSVPPARRSCDPNYSGCLDPNASDYDCAGGSGDGPRYTGQVRVLGNDTYDLDRDGDDIACEEASASMASVSDIARQLRVERATASRLGPVLRGARKGIDRKLGTRRAIVHPRLSGGSRRSGEASARPCCAYGDCTRDVSAGGSPCRTVRHRPRQA
jgi:hypothetical protein